MEIMIKFIYYNMLFYKEIIIYLRKLFGNIYFIRNYQERLYNGGKDENDSMYMWL